MKNRLLFLISILCLPVIVCCQQEAQFTQYFNQVMTLNPAIAGYKEAMQIHLAYRHQWVTTPEQSTPATMMIAIEKGFLKKNIGTGLHVIKDKIGAQKQTSLFFSSAYRIHFSNETDLLFGLAIGCSQYQLDGTKLLAASTDYDPAIPAGLKSTLLMDAKCGIYLKGNNYFLGLSAANIFNNQVDYMGDQRNIVSKQRLHYYFLAGYQSEISPVLQWQSSLLCKDDFKAPTSVDINNMFTLYDNYSIGFSYRTAISLFSKRSISEPLTYKSAAAGIIRISNIKSAFDIGYSYDFNIGNSRSYYGGSHELQLSFAINPQ